MLVKFNNWSLTARLTALGLLSAVLLTSVGSWLLRAQLHDVVQRGVELDLQQHADRLVVEFEAGNLLNTQVPPAGLTEFSRIFSGWYWLLQTPEQLYRSRSLWDANLPLAQLQPWRASATLLQANDATGQFLLGVRRTLSDPAAGVMYVFVPADDMVNELNRIDRVVLSTQLVFVLALLSWVLVQVYLGLIPLRRLRQRLLAISAGEPGALGQSYGSDLNPVAGIIDSVLERNNRIVTRARHQAADLSHALKKPLALLGVSARGDQVSSKLVQEQVQHMSGIIDRHLTRMGSSAGSIQVVELLPMIERLITLMEKIHEARRLQWLVSADQPLRWAGASSDMEEMLGNLLDNAGKWAHSTVSVRVLPHGRGVQLQVDDDGPGMDDSKMALATRRGIRFDQTTEGHGMGLAIVSDLAETYQGELLLTRSERGGLCCQLLLP